MLALSKSTPGIPSEERMRNICAQSPSTPKRHCTHLQLFNQSSLPGIPGEERKRGICAQSPSTPGRHCTHLHASKSQNASH